MNIINLLSEKEKRLVQIKSFKKNHIIFHEGDPCESIGIVLKGEVKISSFSFEGNEMVFNIIKQNEIFANNLIFTSNPIFKGNVISHLDSIVAFINKKNLLYLLQNNEIFLQEYLRFQSLNGQQLNERIRLLSLQDIKERFLYYLFINDGKIEYISITKLAAFLNVQRETLSRIISYLIKENKIARKNKTIILIKL